ncbi:hypothetical protein NU08_0476 [Flavobacterium anhuiense]|uniref:Uncharacterized protein n=1 Tax=Flavobacterium anhuiense TaxID=459526 RepID=A0A444W587_9FLAO|nr:hypothetical protein NU08_0476 [Flavobacterium anhuiense]
MKQRNFTLSGVEGRSNWNWASTPLSLTNLVKNLKQRKPETKETKWN